MERNARQCSTASRRKATRTRRETKRSARCTQPWKIAWELWQAEIRVVPNPLARRFAGGWRGKRGVLAAAATIYKDSSVPARAGATICSHSPLPGIGERPGLLRIEKYICLDMENVQ
jgi:hypothetical protein